MSAAAAAMPPFDVVEAPLVGTQLIEASAGTGKTWTLSTLVLRLVIEQGRPISSILVVTFTKATAAELRERVRARLGAALLALQARTSAVDAALVDASLAPLLDRVLERTGLPASTLIDRLNEALAAFEEAAVLTIHAFCQRALSETAFAARMPLEHEVRNDDDALRLDAVADHWRTHVAARDWPDALAAQMTERGEHPQAWQALLKRMQSTPLAHVLWPDGVLAVEAAAGVELQPLQEASATSFRDAAAVWRRERGAILTLVAAAYERRDLHKSWYAPDCVAEAALAWDRLFSSADPLQPIDWKEPIQLFTTDKLAKCKAAPRHAFFDLASDFRHANVALFAATGHHRLALVRDMLQQAGEALQRTKARQRLMTYNDLLSRLHERLAQDPALVRALRHRFPVALVDEFQDTDALQLDIFQRLYRDTDAPVFLVGDPKQAIYAFRGADLHSYLAARNRATQTGTLTENQRSTPSMIAALNSLFTRHDNALGDPGLRYHRVTASERRRSVLTDRRADAHGAALALWSLPGALDGSPLSRAQARTLAIEACAADIAANLAAASRGELLLDGEPLQGGHIAVIVDTHANGRAMRSALAAVGVPSVERSRSSVLQSAEADELSRVMHGLQHPGDAGLVRSALATEMLDVDASILAVTLSAASSPTTDLAQPADRFDHAFERMAAWRTLWFERGIAAMLWRLFDDVHLARRMLSRPDGERRMTNWLHLLELLNDEAQDKATPAALLAWLDTHRTEPDPRDDVLLRLDTDRQLVQIVTSHFAKGLEFPWVYAPVSWQVSCKPAQGRGSSYHDAQGRHVIDFRGADDPGIKADINARMRHEAETEGLRKIYVTLTRAVHRCVLVVDAQARMTGSKRDHASLKSMLNWVVGGGGMDLDAWRAVDAKNAALRAAALSSAWQQVADSSDGHVCLRAVERAAVTIVAPSIDAPPPSLILDRAAPGPVAAAWRTGSFSAWVLDHAGDETPALDDGGADGAGDDPVATSDVDADVTFSDIGRPSDDVGFAAAPDDVLRFPRGASAGNTIHALLEHVDFTQPAGWRRAAQRALTLHPTAIGASSPRRVGHPDGIQPDDDALQAMLVSMLTDVSNTELLPDMRLGDVEASRRINELAFDMSLVRPDVPALARALRAMGKPPIALSPSATQTSPETWLRGAIDMVFEHDGRYYLIDWKSNHLGEHPRAYHRTSMDQAMAQHGYGLQLTLYALAMRRHLRFAVGKARADAAWGGAFVLFVRGVRPGWLQDDGRPAGVWFERLSFDNLKVLDALLDASDRETGR